MICDESPRYHPRYEYLVNPFPDDRVDRKKREWRKVETIYPGFHGAGFLRKNTMTPLCISLSDIHVVIETELQVIPEDERTRFRNSDKEVDYDAMFSDYPYLTTIHLIAEKFQDADIMKHWYEQDELDGASRLHVMMGDDECRTCPVFQVLSTSHFSGFHTALKVLPIIEDLPDEFMQAVNDIRGVDGWEMMRSVAYVHSDKALLQARSFLKKPSKWKHQQEDISLAALKTKIARSK
jgi:hypothetical protein